MTATPIPAGVLTVDDEPIPDGHTPLLYVIRWADGTGFKVVEADERARLLAGPTRPDEVPDELSDWGPLVTRQCVVCPECAFTFDAMHTGPGDDYTCPLCHPEQPQRPDGVPHDATSLIAAGLVAFDFTRQYVGYDVLPEIEGWSWFDWCRRAETYLRDAGVPVPPYQPDPDPADSPTGLVATPLTYTPPASGGERTGPLGLSEADTRKIAKQNESWVALAVGSGTLACKAWDAAQGACRAAVAEWDRIEAASRPDPDTITVNLPRATAEWVANQYHHDIYPGHLRTISLAAAAGLPREPTEGEQS